MFEFRLWFVGHFVSFNLGFDWGLFGVASLLVSPVGIKSLVHYLLWRQRCVLLAPLLVFARSIPELSIYPECCSCKGCATCYTKDGLLLLRERFKDTSARDVGAPTSVAPDVGVPISVALLVGAHLSAEVFCSLVLGGCCSRAMSTKAPSLDPEGPICRA